MTDAKTFGLKQPLPTAVYLPALGAEYYKTAYRSAAKTRPFRSGFEPRDLAFWSGSSRLWNHHHVLHSIGGHGVGSDTKDKFYHQDRDEFILLGDSGGYQIGAGTLKGLQGLKKGITAEQAQTAWAANYDAKLWIIDWLERYSDYAMTLDMPLWAMTADGVKSPFHRCNAEQLTAMTVENLRLIEDNREGRTQWLNVIQGSNDKDILPWWEAVKWFRHGGWSLAGAAGWKGGLYNVLTTVLRMRDEAAFVPGQNWIHVLGVSQPRWFVFLTAIQRCLRRDNPVLQISCDSATPSIKGGKKDEYILPVHLDSDIKNWAFQFATLNTYLRHASPNCTEAAPLHSPVGQGLMMNELAVNPDPLAGRRLDTLSSQIIVNHNMWVILDAAERANAMAFGQDRHLLLPPQLAEAVDVIEAAFAAQDWASVLQQNRVVLDRAGPNEYTAAKTLI